MTDTIQKISGLYNRDHDQISAHAVEATVSGGYIEGTSSQHRKQTCGTPVQPKRRMRDTFVSFLCPKVITTSKVIPKTT
ncbi:hypothetical protein [Oceanobacter sp. 4_MG-2023]|uniref:hypothetical protein n=1 Tax=Oceanobacter sp. 4_MG-2023 TaxID=3062623 RepID=UPI002734A90F|nr:hypothetical protein [Oceanobacter sp. 4_MG-2023]MDP2548439.1 hypothetical protein [Oceanobacter sp. 4_MG-2023]